MFKFSQTIINITVQFMLNNRSVNSSISKILVFILFYTNYLASTFASYLGN